MSSLDAMNFLSIELWWVWVIGIAIVAFALYQPTYQTPRIIRNIVEAVQGPVILMAGVIVATVVTLFFKDTEASRVVIAIIAAVCFFRYAEQFRKETEESSKRAEKEERERQIEESERVQQLEQREEELRLLDVELRERAAELRQRELDLEMREINEGRRTISDHESNDQ